ncbi:MAG: O-antigen ligase family protein [Solirubrobacteraceae bacterium]
MADRLLSGPGLLAPIGLLGLLAGAAAAASPGLALAGVGTIVLLLLVVVRADWLLLVLVAALPWEDALAFPSETVTIVKLLGVLLFGAWCLRSLAGEERLRLPGVLLPVVLLGLAVGVSLVVSSDPAAGVLVAVRYGLFIVFFFLVIQLTETLGEVTRIVRVVVISAALAAAWALYQFVVLGHARAGGPIADPNDFAYVIACMLPLSGYLLSAERGRRLLWAACFVLLVAAVLATLSRGALVGLAALAVWGAVSRRIPIGGVALGLMALLGVIAVAFAAWAPILQDRIESKGRIADRNVGSRQAFWEGSLRMAADRPLVGVGPGGFGREASDYVRDDPLGIDQPVVHNSYLEVLAELGLLGLLPFVAFLGAVWRLLGRARARAVAAADDEGRRLTTAMQATMVIAVVSAFFLSVQLTTPFWLVGALAAVVAGSGAYAERAAAVRRRTLPPASVAARA